MFYITISYWICNDKPKFEIINKKKKCTFFEL